MRTTACVLVVSLLITILSPFTLAQAICDVSMSITECQTRVSETLNPNDFDSALLEEQSKKDQANKLSVINTGTGSNNSTIDDFAAKLLSNITSDNIGNDSDVAFRFEWINPIGKLPNGHAYKLAVSAEEATVFEPLVAAVNDDALTDPLDDDLNVMDNLSFELGYSISNRRFGRDIQQHHEMFGLLFQSELEAAKVADADVVRDRWSGVTRFRNRIRLADNVPVMELDLADYSGNFTLADCADVGIVSATQQECFDDLKMLVLESVEKIRTADESFLVNLDRRLDTGSYSKLVKLLNNQPQLIFKVSGTKRDDRVGPNEYSLSFRWETGFTNLNTVLKQCPTRVGGVANPNYESCITGELGQIKDKSLANDRVFVSLEYNKRDDYKLALPVPAGASAVMFALEGHESVIAKAGYGRYLSFAEDGTGQTRIDFSASYEKVSGEPSGLSDDQTRNDRTKIDVVFSRKLQGNLVGTFGVSYADKPEYLKDTDEKLTANVGISYKFAQDNDF